MYVLIVFVATFLGAAVGLGGGVIIKPCFDLINMHNTATIGVYSAMAVFTMSIVSIYKQYKNLRGVQSFKGNRRKNSRHLGRCRLRNDTVVQPRV